MRVSIIGTGYVGLVTGVCMAEKGHDVVCVDLDEARVHTIRAGRSPIFENGLEQLLKKNIDNRMTATTNLEQAVLESDITIIAVGTPFDGHQIDLQYIERVCEQIGRALQHKHDYHLVLVKSTVVPGTTDGVVRTRLEQFSGKRVGDNFGLGMNPEFLREGAAVDDCMHPDRIVLGGIDEKSHATMAKLYEVFGSVDTVFVDTKTAEMIKYTANALFATLISFSNEMANLSATLDIDAKDVMRGVYLDKRLAPIAENGDRMFPSFISYLDAGCGFGGSCFPKDVKAIIACAELVGSPVPILKAVIDVNEMQPQKMIELTKRHYPTLAGVKVAVLGVAFKPGTSDIREAPSLAVIDTLLREDAIVKVFDPAAGREAERRFKSTIKCADNLNDAIDDVDVILIMTRWKHFDNLPSLIGTLDTPPLVIDGRRMLDKKSVPRYEGIGL